MTQQRIISNALLHKRWKIHYFFLSFHRCCGMSLRQYDCNWTLLDCFLPSILLTRLLSFLLLFFRSPLNNLNNIAIGVRRHDTVETTNRG